MIADPRAQQALDEFAAEWLRFDLRAERRQGPHAVPAVHAGTGRRHDGGDPPADRRPGLERRNFMDLFTADYTFVNSDLASLYGVPRRPTNSTVCTFPADSGTRRRPGAGTFLAPTSKPGETSPTVRGYFVREQFLCHQVPDPPPGHQQQPAAADRRPSADEPRAAARST